MNKEDVKSVRLLRVRLDEMERAGLYGTDDYETLYELYEEAVQRELEREE